MRPYLKETQEVMQFIRTNILKKLLIMMANILEVPEEQVLATHAAGGSKTEYIRYIMCEPRPKEESEKYRDIFLSAHTDWGSWTFLFSQPIAVLQVLGHNDGKYRWVEHQPQGLVVNFGEATERMTGGLFKATIHRVVQPPEDQRHLRRIGVIYFARPADDRELVPIENSPLLKRLGVDKPMDDGVFCMADYLDARKHEEKQLARNRVPIAERSEAVMTISFLRKVLTSWYFYGFGFLWILGNCSESHSTQSLLNLYIKALLEQDYTVPLLNNYPTGV
ncbi:hypothetical protein LQW54_008540 [Pestalotiopsis sp. IQ-011]